MGPTTPTTGNRTVAVALNELADALAADGLSLNVTVAGGTLTATVDESTLATSALQSSVGATAHTDSGLILASLLAPGSHTPITPSDSTDITAIASIGFQCTVDGSLSYRGVTTSSTTVTQPVVAGQYIYGRFSRCMAATTATVIGLAP